MNICLINRKIYLRSFLLSLSANVKFRGHILFLLVEKFADSPSPPLPSKTFLVNFCLKIHNHSLGLDYNLPPFFLAVYHCVLRLVMLPLLGSTTFN